jgi:DNA repair exonuclease SbcCD nuclease subunit
MKIVAFSDVHAHSFKDFSRNLLVKWNGNAGRYEEVSEQDSATSMNSRLFNILSGLSDIKDYCKEHNITTCLMAGDLFHSRGSVETVTFNGVYHVFEAFHSEGIRVIMLSGNHDQFDSSAIPENSLYSFNSICDVIDNPQVVELVDEETGEVIELCCLPYSKHKTMLKDFLDDYIKNSNKSIQRILMAHLGLSGSLIGSGSYVISDEWNIHDLHENKFKYTVLGHYHKPQFLTEGCFYCGSILQNNFNDEGDLHGFMVLDTNRRYDVEQVPLNYPEFITLNKDNLCNYDSEYLKGQYVRVSSTAADAEEVMSKLSDIVDEDKASEIRVEVEKDYDVDARSDVSITQTNEEIIQTYVAEKSEQEQYNKEFLDLLIAKGLEIMSKVSKGE